MRYVVGLCLCVSVFVCAPRLDAATLTVNAGGDLQGAIDAARPGDTILIAAGAVFTGNYTLPDKGGSTYITIRSAASDASLPAAGVRIDPSYAAAVRAMPGLVPTSPDDPASEANRAAWDRLAAWDKPFLVAFSDRDPITGAMAPVLKRTVPGAAGLDHPVLEGAGHFLQEDAGERLGAVIAEFVRAHPAS